MPDTPTRVMEAILAYVAVQPGAADTARGIRDVWLRAMATPEEVEAALEQLVSRASLLALPLPDGSVLFTAAGRGSSL